MPNDDDDDADGLHLGLPFKRIESFQNMMGMPLPDATQWDLVEQVGDGTYPVFDALKDLGAQQPLVYQDDTGARILSLIKENQADPPPERKGMYTTVLRFEGQHTICLYFTGRRHAGENLDAMLADTATTACSTKTSTAPTSAISSPV